MLIDRNNLHDIDTWMFFKWIFKTAAAILILSNTFNIVNAIFDVSQSVIASSAGVIQGSTDISPDMLADLEATLETMGLGSLLGLWLQSIFIGFTMTCVGIYAVLIQGIATGGDPIGAIWGAVGYTVLLCFMLFKTGTISKSIFGAH